jgi:oligoribonuclease NrnB/cAMP/cGMP phosphodiesterase (DHH superfamily)
MNVLFVSHAADMDGVSSLLLAQELAYRTYEHCDDDFHTTVVFANYEDAEELIEAAVAQSSPDAVFLTDLSWRQDVYAKYFPNLPKDRFWLFDHHYSSKEVVETWRRAGCPNLFYCVDGDVCTADLVWSQLSPLIRGSVGRYVSDWEKLVESTSAVDLWKIHTHPDEFTRGKRLSSVLTQIGPHAMLDALIEAPELADTSKWGAHGAYGNGFEWLLAAHDRQFEASLATANATTHELEVKLRGANVKLRACYVLGHASDIGHDLVDGELAIAAMVCMKNRNLSFRSNKETLEASGVSCADVAGVFGGGGHPLAAGAPIREEYYSLGLYQFLGDLQAACHYCVEDGG